MCSSPLQFKHCGSSHAVGLPLEDISTTDVNALTPSGEIGNHHKYNHNKNDYHNRGNRAVPHYGLGVRDSIISRRSILLSNATNISISLGSFGMG